jgi:chloride channel protein, CIC family
LVLVPDAKDGKPASSWLDPASPRFVRHVAALVAVATLTALFGIAFRAAASFLFHELFRASDVVSSFEALRPRYRLPLVVAGALAAGLVGRLASRHRSGQGVGGVMEAVALGTGRISLRASLWKALGCWLAIVTGSSIGREGPIIQFGGAIGGTAGSLANLSPERTRILIAAGTAAGFASAYNTPFAAVLFVLEIVMGVFALDVVLATVLAAALSTTVTRFALGGGPIYGERAFTLGFGGEAIAFLAVGLGAGVLGPAFSALLLFAERSFERLPLKQPFVGGLGGVLVGTMAIALPEITGNGYEVINRMLDGDLIAKSVVVLLIAKVIATSASVGSGTPGGAFTPSLFVGAALGGLAGDLLRTVWPAHANVPGACALIGMAAMCAATTHAPLMAAVLVFELSGDYSIVLPLLLATGTATLVSRRIRGTSMYMDELARRGVGWRMTWSGRVMEPRADGAGG